MSGDASICPADLAVVERALREACGFSLAPAVRRSLPGRVAQAAHAAGLDQPAFIAALERGDRTCVDALVEASVVSETYFFRQPEHFDALRALARQRPASEPITIWSAACATGEEAYSAAITLLEAGRAAGTDAVLDGVLATDVSRRCIALARAGRYGPWSLRRVDEAARSRWFTPAGDQLEIAPAPRRLVRFAEHNLTNDPPPAGGFDVVLCRNVLIYFDALTATTVLERLHGALRPGGLLFLASAEVPLAAGLAFEPVELGGSTALRRVTSPPRRVSPAPPPARPPPRRPARAMPVQEAAVLEPRPTPVPVEPPAAGQEPLSAEAFLVAAVAADACGDAESALAALRRALYLDPQLPGAHAHAARVFEGLGRSADAARSRANALAALAVLDDAAPVAGFDDLTAGALRRALERTA